MRLWHKLLIPVLPRQQLCSQWRECCLIAKCIAENGTPNHILVNRILDHPLSHFEQYCIYVNTEMKIRGYRCDWTKLQKYLNHMDLTDTVYPGVFNKWHNDTYLRQCLYNLEEKAICGGIPKEEWQRIYEKFNDFTPLWKE